MIENSAHPVDSGILMAGGAVLRSDACMVESRRPTHWSHRFLSGVAAEASRNSQAVAAQVVEGSTRPAHAYIRRYGSVAGDAVLRSAHSRRVHVQVDRRTCR